MALDLLLHGPWWVDRRAEKIEFLDDQFAQRVLTIDFQLPDQIEPVLRPRLGSEVPPSTYFVPITMYRKNGAFQQPSGVERFELTDGAGKVLPLLPRSESARITAYALLALANRTLKRQVSGELANLIARIALIDPYVVPTGVSALLHRESRAWRSPRLAPSRDERAALLEDPQFTNLASWCAVSSMVIAPLTLRKGERHTVKLSWGEYLGPDPEVIPNTPARDGALPRRHRLARMGSRLGLRPTIVSLPMAHIGGSASHHIRVETPPEVEIAALRLLARDPARIWTDSADEVNSSNGYAAARPGRRQRAHIYVPSADVPRFGNLRVELQASRRGFAFGAVAAAAMIAATLWFYVAAADTLVEHVTSAASILLLLPGLLAAYIVRPGEHLMSRKMRDLFRYCLALDGLLVVIAAAAYVAFGPPTDQAARADASLSLLSVWLSCAVISSAILVLLLVGWVRPQLPRKRRGQ